MGDAEELALEVSNGFVRAGNHGACQQRGFASDACHHGIGNVSVGRRDRGADRLHGVVRGASGNSGTTSRPERVVDVHEIFPCSHFIGGGLVRRVDRPRDCAHFIGVQPTKHLDEDPKLHIIPTARCPPGLSTLSASSGQAVLRFRQTPDQSVEDV